MTTDFLRGEPLLLRILKILGFCFSSRWGVVIFAAFTLGITILATLFRPQ